MDAPYWDNESLPSPTATLPDYYFVMFKLLFFIFIENKCLFMIWDLKRD